MVNDIPAYCAVTRFWLMFFTDTGQLSVVATPACMVSVMAVRNGDPSCDRFLKGISCRSFDTYMLGYFRAT